MTTSVHRQRLPVNYLTPIFTQNKAKAGTHTHFCPEPLHIVPTRGCCTTCVSSLEETERLSIQVTQGQGQVKQFRPRQATHSRGVNTPPRPGRCPRLGRLFFQQDRASLYSRLFRSTSSANQTHCSSLTVTRLSFINAWGHKSFTSR